MKISFQTGCFLDVVKEASKSGRLTHIRTCKILAWWMLIPLLPHHPHIIEWMVMHNIIELYSCWYSSVNGGSANSHFRCTIVPYILLPVRIVAVMLEKYIILHNRQLLPTGHGRISAPLLCIRLYSLVLLVADILLDAATGSTNAVAANTSPLLQPQLLLWLLI